jgi:hypothetical protein
VVLKGTARPLHVQLYSEFTAQLSLHNFTLVHSVIPSVYPLNQFLQILGVYLQQIKKKAKAECKTCHAKTMLSLEKPIELI